MQAHVRAGRVDGGPYSLAFRETVKDHPHVRTLVLDRGNHAGMVYLSDPHWFGLAALSYLKHWQARDVEGLGRCARDGNRLTWTLPRLSGGKTTAGPFVAVVDIAGLKPGRFAATAWVEQDGVLRQEVTLEKK